MQQETFEISRGIVIEIFLKNKTCLPEKLSPLNSSTFPSKPLQSLKPFQCYGTISQFGIVNLNILILFSIKLSYPDYVTFSCQIFFIYSDIIEFISKRFFETLLAS